MGQALRGRRGSHVVGGPAAGRMSSLWICLLPSSSPSKLQLARWGGFLANTEISQCLLLFFPSVCGKIPPTPGQGMCLRCCLSSDSSSSLETYYPETPSSGGRGRRFRCATRQRHSGGKLSRGGHVWPPASSYGEEQVRKTGPYKRE